MNLPASTGYSILSASSWGGSDFVGGVGAKRAPALLVTAAGQIISFLLLVVICFALRIAMPGRHDALLSIIGGAEGALALVIFYRALAMGGMGLTAALTGLLTAVIPVGFSAFYYGLPGRITAAGLLLGCVAIWLITHQKNGSTPRRALLLGAIAGIGFGTQLVLFKLASQATLLGMMTVVRAAGIGALLVAIAAMRTPLQKQNFWIAGAVSGLLDTAGNLFYLGASRVGRLDSAAVICSLYPAGTIVLAAIVLRERPTLRQLSGMAVALAAVALLSF